MFRLNVLFAAVGYVYVPINTGGEGRAQLVFAHSGEVAATLAPMPKAN
jgi:hypothetical protein